MLFYQLVRSDGRNSKLPERPEPLPNADDPSYKMALARSRMSVHVQAATSYMKTGDPARAMVELGRALQENDVSRWGVRWLGFCSMQADANWQIGTRQFRLSLRAGVIHI